MAYRRFSRSELHSLVWTRPLRDAADVMGVSIGALKSICNSYSIPTPPSGFWTALPYGPPRAPALADGRPEQVIHIQIADRAVELPPEEAERCQALLDREADPAFAIPVRASGRGGWHPIAERVEEILAAAKPDDYGCLSCVNSELPYVRVTPAGAYRAVALVDALARSFDARNFRWKPGGESSHARTAQVVVEGVTLRLEVYENTTRRHHVLTEQEKKARQSRPWFSPPLYDYVGTDQFVIRQYESQAYVKDGARRKVEDRLNDLMRILIQKAFATRDEGRLREIAAAREAARAALRAELDALKAKKKVALEQIELSAIRWRKAEDLRSFITAVAGMPSSSPEFDAHRSKWLEWARAHVQDVDPLIHDPMAALAVDFNALNRLTELQHRVSE